MSALDKIKENLLKYKEELLKKNPMEKLMPEIKRMMKEEDMASPEHPKGLENKRKPVTHDECGRPFAKEEQRAENESGEKIASPEHPEGKVDKVVKQDEPDPETKKFLEHWESR